ncbi:hypothetical protein A6E01_19925 (plasmid) [Vibrio breoganii]|uniref:Uncharacterized protein n=1 Tax=Vibrio breoganii TaxID=553239 RepID=A0AAN0XZY6_9VIBR|nr:hypothetical protein [Vibrio breoganii]ANO35484.1 hypothetical protein A6E01_19925 [Vibrio breoganii]PML13912.1 hypothetical protein BCT84_12190 [Vibrio breoganii]
MSFNEAAKLVRENDVASIREVFDKSLDVHVRIDIYEAVKSEISCNTPKAKALLEALPGIQDE